MAVFMEEKEDYVHLIGGYGDGCIGVGKCDQAALKLPAGYVSEESVIAYGVEHESGKCVYLDICSVSILIVDVMEGKLSLRPFFLYMRADLAGGLSEPHVDIAGHPAVWDRIKGGYTLAFKQYGGKG